MRLLTNSRYETRMVLDVATHPLGHGLATAGGQDVMRLAVRLKEVTVQSRSTVKTPSAMLSMIDSQGMCRGKAMLASSLSSKGHAPPPPA